MPHANLWLWRVLGTWASPQTASPVVTACSGIRQIEMGHSSCSLEMGYWGQLARQSWLHYARPHLASSRGDVRGAFIWTEPRGAWWCRDAGCRVKDDFVCAPLFSRSLLPASGLGSLEFSWVMIRRKLTENGLSVNPQHAPMRPTFVGDQRRAVRGLRFKQSVS